MNSFYIAKKLNYFSGKLNIFGTFAWMLLIGVIFYYHYFILINFDPKKGNYSQIVQLLSSNLDGQDTKDSVQSIQQTNFYPWAVITEAGYSSFFGADLVKIENVFSISCWNIVLPLFIITLVCYIAKTIFSIFVLYVSIKTKSIMYIYSSLLNIFLPFFGGIISNKINKSNKKIIQYKQFAPLQLFRYLTKKTIYLMSNDSQIKNF